MTQSVYLFPVLELSAKGFSGVGGRRYKQAMLGSINTMRERGTKSHPFRYVGSSQSILRYDNSIILT